MEKNMRYIGTRLDDGCIVVRSSPKLFSITTKLDPRFDLANHSPDGFNWGRCAIHSTNGASNPTINQYDVHNMQQEISQANIQARQKARPSMEKDILRNGLLYSLESKSTSKSQKEMVTFPKKSLGNDKYRKNECTSVDENWKEGGGKSSSYTKEIGVQGDSEYGPFKQSIFYRFYSFIQRKKSSSGCNSKVKSRNSRESTPSQSFKNGPFYNPRFPKGKPLLLKENGSGFYYQQGSSELHSRTCINCSGPAQLALALCADALHNDHLALEVYQEFKEKAIASIAANSWVLTVGDVLNIIEEIITTRQLQVKADGTRI